MGNKNGATLKSSAHPVGSYSSITRYLQFKDEHHLVLILEGVVEVDQLAVVQVVHDVDLLPDQGLL